MSDANVYDHGASVDPETTRNYSDEIIERNPDPETTERAIEALTRPQDTSNVAPEDLNGRGEHELWPARDDLPGRGRDRDVCGDYLPMFCEHCGKVHDGSNRCSRSSCPECWPTWARKQATEIGSRALALRAKLDAQRDEHVKCHHVTMSLPEMRTFLAADPTERAIDCVREFFHVLDIPVIMLYHAWRIDTDVDYGYEGDWTDSRGEWKRVLNQGDTMADIRDELTFAPHFHLIAITDWFPGQHFTERVYEETGWVIKRITKQGDSKASIYNNEDLAAVLTYCLSHTGIYTTEAGNQSARYRYIGAGWQDGLEVQERYKQAFDATVREAAPRTLGIPFRDLACHNPTLSPATLNVDIKRGQAAAASSSSTGTTSTAEDLGPKQDADMTGEVQVGAGLQGESEGESLLPDDPGASVEVAALEDAEFCEGRLLPPWKMREHVTDPEWIEAAEHGVEAARAYVEWADDDDPAREDVVLEDDPPPD